MRTYPFYRQNALGTVTHPVHCKIVNFAVLFSVIYIIIAKKGYVFEKLFLNDLLDTSHHILMFFTCGSTEPARIDDTLF